MQTEFQGSFQGSFTSRGSYRTNFDLIYGLNFVSTNIGVKASSRAGYLGCTPEQIGTYSSVGAQLNLSVEGGPMLMVNGKMKLDSEPFESYIAEGYNATTHQTYKI